MTPVDPALPPSRFPFSAGKKCDVITMVAVPILLAIAASLAIYYAVHPVAPFVQLSPQLFLSLPLLICGGTGLALTIVLAVQIIRRRQVKEAFSYATGHCLGSGKGTTELLRNGLHIGARKDNQTTEEYRRVQSGEIQVSEEQIGPMKEFQTRDGVTLRGFWHRSDTPDAPTVIFFHGNGGVADGQSAWGDIYKRLEFNVLLLEYRGYGISEGSAAGPNQEMEAYLDAEAALAFVHSRGVQQDKIVAHGYSLGGAYAAALGYFFGLRCIFLDHSFSSFADVCSHVAKGVVGSMTTQIFIEKAYEQRRMEAHPGIPEALPLETDGFDTLTKVSRMRGEIFVVRGEEDHLMPMGFGQQLVEAKYPDPVVQRARLLTMGGGHNPEGHHFNEAAYGGRLAQFYVDMGILSPSVFEKAVADSVNPGQGTVDAGNSNITDVDE